MKIVTTIHRLVAGTAFEPGEECEVHDTVGAIEISNGRATAVAEKPKADAKVASPPAPTKAAEPAKASTEVKPMTLADAPNQGEYATRDLKAKG